MRPHAKPSMRSVSMRTHSEECVNSKPNQSGQGLPGEVSMRTHSEECVNPDMTDWFEKKAGSVSMRTHSEECVNRHPRTAPKRQGCLNEDALRRVREWSDNFLGWEGDHASMRTHSEECVNFQVGN